MEDSKRRDEELARLRRQVVLARFYLERFADPKSFVWAHADRSPDQFAREALAEMGEEKGAPVDLTEEVEDGFPRGTERMPRLSGGRAGFVEFHQVLARQALDVGRIGAARAALWVLRASDFSTAPDVAQMLLSVLRDTRASDEEIAEAVLRLTQLEASTGEPTPK
jgi:hypothetical protein